MHEKNNLDHKAIVTVTSVVIKTVTCTVDFESMVSQFSFS